MDVKKALELYSQTKTYWGDIYDAFKEDVRFSIGLDHYVGKSEKECREQGLMVVPVLPQYIHQVVNDMRMNTPSIDVLPSTDGDIETAKVIKGKIRDIEYKSRADEVYDTAGEYAVRGGFGYARVDHGYVHDGTELQELRICRVHNPESVYLDPSYTECDGSDATFGFALEVLSRKDFEAKYPGKDAVSFTDAPTKGIDEKEVTIAEFFWKEIEEQPEGSKQRRKITIKRYKFSGADILEETKFPGMYVPIVPFLGEEVWVDGKRYLLSLIRQAKDAQRRINKYASAESKVLDMSPVAPILAPFGAVEDFADEYTKVGDVNVIRYKMTDANGNRLDKPERLAPPPVPVGFANAVMSAKESVKESLGMYNASLGARSNETSGVAINARKVEGEVATFHFADNRNRSIQQIGRILVCAMPEIYDTDRIERLIGEEDEVRMVGINGAQMQKGQKQDYDLRKGIYDVRVTTGASYTTKRQEGAALMGEALAKNPQLMQIIGDLYFKHLDIAGAESIAARIKKTIPPQLLEGEDGEEQKPFDPEKQQMAQIIQQLQGKLQQIAPQVQAMESELKSKQGELQVKAADTQIKAETESKKLELQQQQAVMDYQLKTKEIELKERELAIKEAELAIKAQQGMEKEAEQANQKGFELPEGLQVTRTPEALAMEDSHKQQEFQLEQADMQLRAEQGQALIQALSGIQQQLAQMAQPRAIKVMRDENGQIIGAN